MTSYHPTEPDSAPNSVASTPRSDHPLPPPARWHHDDDDAAPRVRLMCSFGGRILPRPHDNQLRYVGGDTRIVAVHRCTTFSALRSKLDKLGGASDLAIKYQLPNEDLDALISVTTDEDVENMMEEYDRLVLSAAVDAPGRTPRLRLFLFPAGADDDGGFGSILDRSGSKRDSWFLDVLNGGAGRLERGRSEASSIMSEVPDYLFGLDNNSDEPKPKSRRAIDNASDPGSPIPAMSWPKHSSTSSAPSVPPIPDLPPVKTKPETAGPEETHVPLIEPQIQQTSYTGNPLWQFVQEPAPVYYMPGPVQGSNIPVRPVPISVQYFDQFPQVPVGYNQPVQGVGYNPQAQGVWTNPGHAGPFYVGGPPVGRAAVGAPYDYPAGATAMAVESYEVPAGGGLMKNPGTIPVYPTTGVPPMGGEPPSITGSEMRLGRGSQ